jgi:hypothetical protein
LGRAIPLLRIFNLYFLVRNYFPDLSSGISPA